MPSRLPLSRFLALLPLGFVLAGAVSTAIVAAPVARAEDAPTEEKPKKKETDDASIFADWKLCKQRGAKHCQTRAEFWEGKGAAGKDLYFLGLMWKRGENLPKAVEALEKFLEYKPPADDQKLVANNATNREGARLSLIEANLDGKQYAKAVAAAEAFREEYPAAKDTIATWDWQGRAHRLAGEDDKAVEAFAKAIEGKFAAGLLDLVDLHLASGDVAAAKAAFEKWPKDDSAGFRDKFIQHMKAFVDAVGTPVEFEKAVNVGRGSMPELKGKPTLFYYWHLQVGLPDRKLNGMDTLRRSLSDKANVVGVGKYNQYNPDTEKKEQDMTPEKENDWYKAAIEKWGIALPCIVVPNELADALFLKFEGQYTVTDAEGKLRYMRINGEKPYDKLAVALALEKAAAPPPPK